MSGAGDRRLVEVLAENAELRRELEASAAKIEELTATNASLLGLVDELTRRIAELEKRLGKDSSNSSLPPSSDRFKRARPESPSRAAQRAAGRKPGKQPGAEGRHLAQVEDPDEVVVLTPERCCDCGLDLADAPTQATEVRQVLDVPIPRLESTEYRAETKRCRCGATTKAAFPRAARGHVSYGPKLRAVALYLLSYQHLPFERCAAALSDLFGAEVSTGFLDHLYSEGAAGLEAFMAAVLSCLLESEVVHVDETFDHVGKHRAWFHVACDELYTLLHADMTRGTAGTEATGLFPSFTGVAVHDRLAQYFSYDKATHAICCAHLIRDLASVAAEPTQRPWASSMTALLVKMKLATEKAREAGDKHMDETVLADLFSRYDTVVSMALSLNVAPAGRARDGLERDAFNLAVALGDRKDDVLRFLSDLRVPFTNNQAESDVRMVKLHSKISGPFRALHGAERLATVRSYLSTAAKHGLRPFEVLTALFAGEAWIPRRT